MKKKLILLSLIIFSSTSLFVSCSSNDVVPETPIITGVPLGITPASLNFGQINNTSESNAKTFSISTYNVTSDITINAPAEYKISTDNTNFSSTATIPAASLNNSAVTIYTKFTPTSVGLKTGNITVSSGTLPQKQIQVNGESIARIFNYPIFDNVRLAFGGGFSQSASQIVNLPSSISNIQKIYAYVKLRCPDGGCNAWDVYANLKIKDNSRNEYYEIGRFITPYGVNNSQAGRGFKIDITDFRSLLSGSVEFKSFIEVWGADGWLLSVDIDFVEGTPDYPYYGISKVIEYNNNSLDGVVYGEDASAFDLTKSIQIPNNSENTSFRTIITGWGHATPNDADGRPCAEWCYRTHNIYINNNNTFSHYLGPIGCSSNPVRPQSGNWSPDRAGWCPGMAVPVRNNVLANSNSGQTLNYEYKFQLWTNNLQSTASNIHAYYALSSYVIVKSNTPINNPSVTN